MVMDLSARLTNTNMELVCLLAKEFRAENDIIKEVARHFVQAPRMVVQLHRR